MASETQLLEIDWDNDGLFAHAQSDVSDDILEIPTYYMGRDYASQLYGRSSAGVLNVVLRNDDAKYSRFNTGSAIFGKIKANRRVRLKSRRDNAERAAQFVRANSESLSIADNAVLSSGDVHLGIGAWVRLDTKANDMVIDSKWSTTGNLREYLLGYDTSDDKFFFSISRTGTSGTSVTINADTPTPVSTGQSYFVFGWHDPDANTVNIQVDDGTIYSAAHSNGMTDLTSTFRIGARGNTASTFWDGRIGPVGVWKDQLISAAVRTSLRNTGKALLHADLTTAMKTGLVAYWNCTEASGTRTDSEGSNDLTDNNTVLDAPGNFGGIQRVQWHGYLDDIVANPLPGGANEAALEAFGVIAKADGRKAYVGRSTNILTGTAVTSVLDAIDFPAADRVIDAGKTTMTNWAVPGLKGADALHRVEETEAGFLRETRDAEIAFEDRHHRLLGAHQTAQATYSDAVGAAIFYQAIPQQSPLQQIVNIIRAKVRRQTVAGIATIWILPESGAESPFLDPGEEITFIAQYPTPNANTQDIGVDVWTTPVATTDYTANSAADGSGTDMTADVGIGTVVKSIETMEIPVTNNGSVRMFLTKLEARGTALLEEHEVWVQVKDAASITDYDEREYLIPAEYLPDTNQARDYCLYIAALFGSEQALLGIEYVANETQDAMDDALIRDVSDRVAVTADGLTGLGLTAVGFFVERKEDSIGRDGVHKVRLDLSEADATFGKTIVLDVGPGLDTGMLGWA